MEKEKFKWGISFEVLPIWLLVLNQDVVSEIHIRGFRSPDEFKSNEFQMIPISPTSSRIFGWKIDNGKFRPLEILLIQRFVGIESLNVLKLTLFAS